MRSHNERGGGNPGHQLDSVSIVTRKREKTHLRHLATAVVGYDRAVQVRDPIYHDPSPTPPAVGESRTPGPPVFRPGGNPASVSAPGIHAVPAGELYFSVEAFRGIIGT